MGGSSLKLIMAKGPREGETLEFKPRPAIQIGRVVRGNTVPIKDVGISTKHLSINFKSGKWVIEDLDSSNGTKLNDSKLPPFTPFDLCDGDFIKIGECTSIKVKIEVRIEDDGESRLRRNPRRRAAMKDGGSENVGSVVEKEDFEHNLGLINENCDEELENVGPVVENRGRRVGSRRGKGLKEEDGKAELVLVSENCYEELENVVVVAENRRRRGRPKKATVLKNEATEDLCEVKELERKDNVGPGEEKPGRQLNLRRTRSSTNEEQLVSDSMVQKIPENSSLDSREFEIEDKRTRGGLRKKSNLRDTASEALEIGVSDEKENVEGLDLRDEESEVVEIGVSEEKENVEGLDLQDEALEAVEIGVLEEKENVGGLDLGQDTCKESASGPGVKESYFEVNDGVDLEKMTLGEWFDYLEVHLPKQIYDVTEEMIASMRDRAERFCEFMVKQQNDKGKLPVG